MKKLVALITLVLGSGAATAQEPVDAVVTVGMIGDVVENVGGACANVTALMGPGVDPHLYQAGARDVQTLYDAEVIFYSGYALEGQLGEVLGRFAEFKPTVAVTESAVARAVVIRTDDAYGVDPHIWMDVHLWARTADVVAGWLSSAAPDCAEEIAVRAETYKAQLAALHGWVRESVATIPEGQRILVTAHDAFGYYGRAYGIDVAGIQGVSTEAEAAVADIRETVNLVVERRVPALFVESTINPRTVQSVQEAARRRGQRLEIGTQLYADALGEDGTAGGTYIGMIFENTRNITQALGGTVPPLPEALSGWAEQWDVAAAN